MSWGLGIEFLGFNITLSLTLTLKTLKTGTLYTIVQDVPHRINRAAASTDALRFSLVWKLVFLPKQAGSSTACCLSRPEWGKPACFGSAARLELALQQMAGKKRSSGQLGDS